jgi:hypothetical protein
MGILSDYFVASEEELLGVSARGVPKGLPRVEAKGFGLIPLNSLSESFGVGDEGLEAGEPIHSGDDYAWFVQKLTAEMVDALAALTDAAVPKTSNAMSATEEVDWEPKEVATLLEDLRALALGAKKAKKAMYLWTST